MNAKHECRRYLVSRSAITDLVSTRVRCGALAVNETLPAIAIHQISETRETTHDGAGLFRTLLQIDVVATNDSDLEEIASALIVELHGYVGALGNMYAQAIFLEDSFDEFDEEAQDGGEFIKRLEFVIMWN